MPNVTINKEIFMNILSQFKGDIPFQREIINKVFEDLPTNYLKVMLEDLYYSHVHEGAYYKLSHMTYKSNIHYFKNAKDIIPFLKQWTVGQTSITASAISTAIKKKKPIAGFYITKEEN